MLGERRIFLVPKKIVPVCVNTCVSGIYNSARSHCVKLRGKHDMRQPYRLGRSSHDHHSLFSRVVNVICAMKRYHILSVCLVCLAGLILGYPNEMYMPLNVQQEINRVTKYSKIENNNDSAPIGYMSCSNNPEDEMTTVSSIFNYGPWLVEAYQDLFWYITIKIDFADERIKSSVCVCVCVCVCIYTHTHGEKF